MGNLGATEIMLIFLVVLLLFGAKRIPEIARGMGKGIREFKDATNDIKREMTVGDQPRPAPPPQAFPRYDQQVGVYQDPQAPALASAPAQAPTYGQPGYAEPAAPTPDYERAPAYEPAAPYTSGDAAADLPATGTTGAPYTPLEANDTPPPRTGA